MLCMDQGKIWQAQGAQVAGLPVPNHKADVDAALVLQLLESSPGRDPGPSEVVPAHARTNTLHRKGVAYDKYPPGVPSTFLA